MEKQTIVFSGGTSGLGEVALRKMALEGHSMFLLARNLEVARLKVSDIIEQSSLSIIECDLAAFDSLKNACDQIHEKGLKIDQLVLNAGLWNFSFKESKDGIEEIFHVNLLANIFLIEQLKATINQKGRIIITSSALHQGKINFDDMEFRKNFSGYKAYRQTKLGTILMSKWYANQLKEKEVKVICQHPGVVNTQLGRDAGAFSKMIFKMIGKSSEKGARTLIHLMLTEFDQLASGAYYANSKVKSTHSYSNDMQIAEQLIQKCREYMK